MNAVPFLTERTIHNRIKALAGRIKQDYAKKELHAVCILKGSVHFFSDLILGIEDLDVRYHFFKCSSYEGTTSTGKFQIDLDLSEELKRKHILLVEDIVDTGQTINLLNQHEIIKNCESLEIATLLFKKTNDENQPKPKYIGFSVPDAYYLGYGLDCDQQYRNKRTIYTKLS